jgi:hypothetical protein
VTEPTAVDTAKAEVTACHEELRALLHRTALAQKRLAAARDCAADDPACDCEEFYSGQVAFLESAVLLDYFVGTEWGSLDPEQDDLFVSMRTDGNASEHRMIGVATHLLNEVT